MKGRMKRKEKKRLQEELKRFYEAPPPEGKREFLEFLSQKVPETGCGRGSFLMMQAGYIGKWSWGISLAVFLIGICAANSGRQELFQLVAAAVPFLALAMAAETGRSARYGMEELELSARFSLKTVVAARMGILGIGNLVILGILIPVWGVFGENGFWQTGCSVLIPYFLAAFLQMWVVRKFRGTEGMYACFGITVLVSGLTVFRESAAEWMLRIPAEMWAALTVFLAAMALRESIRYIRQAEEYVWN